MTSKINVLIVDDNDEWRNRFGEAISQETAGQNFECSLAGNYIDALELIAGCENSISVAVIDVCLDKNDLKNEDGLKVADALHKKTERARFVFTYENLSIDQYKRIHTKYQASEVLEKNTAPEDFSDHLLVHAVHEASKKAESLDVFVIMPFKDVYHSFYLNTIKPFFEDRLQICRRADEFFQSGIIMRNIVTYIQAASFSLADLSDRNPNVILEVGIAHALEKNVVMLTREKTSIPDILKPINWNAFREDQPDKLHVCLEQTLETLQRNNYPALFTQAKPITITPGHCVILAPRYGDEANVVKQIIQPVLVSGGYEGINLLNDVHSAHRIEGYWDKISQANLVIADLTNLDLNVFYLVGFAYGLDKPLLFITDDESKIPFDLKNCSYILYPGEFAQTQFANATDELKKSGVLLPAKKISRAKSARKTSTDILMVTATEVECRVVLEEMFIANKTPHRIVQYPLNTYHNLGVINNKRVMMIRTGKGVLAASHRIKDSIQELKPKTIIMVGIAFGARPEEQKLYDVLVSEQITYYELQRITHEAKDLYQVTGDRASSSHKLLNLIQAVYDGQDQIKAHFGLVLSGDKLVDDINYRNHLCNLEPRALGGEMEGAGLSFTANENHVDWILVKGISDWADGSKKIDEHLHQPIAARNAVKLVIQALQVEQID